MWSSHTYHEPTPTTLVILTSFLYFLNLFGWIAQKLLSAGLLGQILIGIIYGTPVAGWLGAEYEEAIVGIGYVGLLIVVFEGMPLPSTHPRFRIDAKQEYEGRVLTCPGGMTTSLDALVQLLPLSICVALTGLLAPIALSFMLAPAFGFPMTHAFAAGAALSSTSLGTILTVLQPRVIGFDLRQTKVGVVLLSAAVMDDVVAFILAKVLSILGSDTDSAALGQGIGRAIGVTIGLAVVFVPLARWVFRPIYKAIMARRARWENTSWGGQAVVLFIMALLFIGLIAAAGYGGTSPLYGVYLAGLVTSYLQRQLQPDLPGIPKSSSPSAERHSTAAGGGQSLGSAISRARSYPIYDTAPHAKSPAEQHRQQPAEEIEDELTFEATFETYLYPLMTYLLLPLFFGSIGYSIPFVALWSGQTIWRGVVYALLMILAKAITGLWLLVWPTGAEGGRGKGWRAGLFLGLAMVARGEIGLL